MSKVVTVRSEVLPALASFREKLDEMRVRTYDTQADAIEAARREVDASIVAHIKYRGLETVAAMFATDQSR